MDTPVGQVPTVPVVKMRQTSWEVILLCRRISGSGAIRWQSMKISMVYLIPDVILNASSMFSGRARYTRILGKFLYNTVY